MTKNNAYDTMVQASNGLKTRGFTEDFEVSKEGNLTTVDGDESFDNNQVELIEFHRFEGESNPSDTAIIYALQTKSGLKGTLVDAYGADGSQRTSEFLNQVKQKQYND